MGQPVRAPYRLCLAKRSAIGLAEGERVCPRFSRPTGATLTFAETSDFRGGFLIRTDKEHLGVANQRCSRQTGVGNMSMDFRDTRAEETANVATQLDERPANAGDAATAAAVAEPAPM